MLGGKGPVEVKIIEDIIWCLIGVPNKEYRRTMEAALKKFNITYPGNVFSQSFDISRYRKKLSKIVNLPKSVTTENIQKYLGFDRGQSVSLAQKC